MHILPLQILDRERFFMWGGVDDHPFARLGGTIIYVNHIYRFKNNRCIMRPSFDICYIDKLATSIAKCTYVIDVGTYLVDKRTYIVI